jgi:hypothetical protein
MKLQATTEGTMKLQEGYDKLKGMIDRDRLTTVEREELLGFVQALCKNMEPKPEASDDS